MLSASVVQQKPGRARECPLEHKIAYFVRVYVFCPIRIATNWV